MQAQLFNELEVAVAYEAMAPNEKPWQAASTASAEKYGGAKGAGGGEGSRFLRTYPGERLSSIFPTARRFAAHAVRCSFVSAKT